MSRPAKFAMGGVLVCLLLSAGSPSAAAQEIAASGGYRIKPSEVAVPAGVKLGDYERTIRPFENWTLICDENLKARQKVCNVTQVIDDADGNLAFSWSLAATRKGRPYMILRTAPTARKNGSLSLRFQGHDRPVDVHLEGCNQTVCVGMMPVGPIMRQQIARKTSPTISYRTVDGTIVTLTAPLDGLSTALAAIN